MPNAMVTGSPERVHDVATALKSQGFDIVAAGEPAPGIEPGSVDCYVQLPAGAVRPDGSAVGQARAVIADELLARFDTAVRLAPLLAPGANVVLVTSGERDGSLPAEIQALRTLISLLAEAIIRDHGPDGVRTTVVDGDHAPEAVAAVGTPATTPPWSELVALEPDLAYSDWRDEVLCLASG